MIMEKKEAIKILKDFHDESALFSVRTALETLYPEFKESEDEKVRKALVEMVHDTTGDELWIDYNVHKEEALAWLKKQGEQKLIDKVEPKFHEGEWVVFNYNHESVYQIEKIENFQYILRHILGGSMHLSFGNEEMVRLWTIQDAKDGDVLKYKGCTFIFKKTEPSDIVTNIKNPLTVLGYCGINHIGFEKTNGWGDTANCKYHPATKEQRELLFTKMREAGWEWDDEKKELKLLITNGGDFFESENCEQKPAWSAEDEYMLESIVSDFAAGHKSSIGQDKWLKSLKDRCDWKPSDEQLEALKNAIHIKPFKNPSDSILWRLYEQLKKLKS